YLYTQSVRRQYHAHYSLSTTHSTFRLTPYSHTHPHTLSLHDALPISSPPRRWPRSSLPAASASPISSSIPTSTSIPARCRRFSTDRKSTRLNSSHVAISYAVFCLKKKIIIIIIYIDILYTSF